MRIVFNNFAVDITTLPDKSMVGLRFIEGMEGEGPDGEIGMVGTGQEFQCRMTREVAKAFIIEMAIELGMMEDQDKPQVASLTDMREELQKRKSNDQGRSK